MSHPVPRGHLSHDKLVRAMIRLCVRVVGHSHFMGVSQIVGMSMMVGIRVFNIGEDLGFVDGLFHGYGRRQQGGQDLCLLRRLIVLVGEEG